MNRTLSAVQDEPTDADLAAIEAEWPLIAAELAVVDAEIAAAQNPHGSCELTPDGIVLIPFLITVLVVSLAVASTVVTVRRDRRFNTVLGARWAKTQRRRGVLAAHRAAVRSTRALHNRDAA
jgi:hypothetical protein